MSGRPLPARHRLIAALALAVATATVRGFPGALAALGVALALAAVERPRARTVLKALVRVNAFFLLLSCTLPLGFGTPEGPALSLGPVHFGLRGALAALVMLIKADAVTLIFLALPGKLDARENCLALRRLGVPEKLTTLLLLMGGYIGLFARELEAMRRAAKLRGFRPRFSPHTVRTSASLAAMLFIRAYDKSERVNEAMRLRGFAGRFVPHGEDAPAGPAAPAFTAACLAAALAIPLVGLYFG